MMDTAKRKKKLPDGWMGKTSRRWLAGRAAEAQHLIEVGCWLGRSTLVLAKATPGKVWAVDTWAGTPQDPDQHEKLYAEFLRERNPYAEFCENLAGPITAGKVVPIRGRSVDAALRLAMRHHHIGDHEVPECFDFVFVDADHSYKAVRADIATYRELLCTGGLLAGHDYHWPGVKRAVDERFPDVVLGPGSIWSTRV